MTAFDEIREENAQLRAELEKSKPGCTTRVEPAQTGKTLPTGDELLAEQAALKAVKAGLVSQQAVQQRGADVVAKYTMRSAASRETIKARMRAGTSAAVISAEGEVARFEELVAGAKVGSKDRACLEANLKLAREKLAQLQGK